MNNNIEIIKKIEEVFPKRSMKVNKFIAERQVITMVIALLFSLSVIIGTTFCFYPGLATDYKISKNPIKVQGYLQGGCKTFKLFITACSIDISYKNHDTKRIYGFIDFHKGKYEVSIIASADDPSLVTIDLAIDKLMNRFLLFISLILIFLFAFLCSIRVISTNLRIKKNINQINGQKLKPVVVPVQLKTDFNILVAIYKIKDSQGKMVKYKTRFNPKYEGGPIIISQGKNGEVNVLGIIGETEAPPVLLDNQFTRCDFTEQEIQELTTCLF